MNPSKKNKLFEKYMAGDISQDEMHELNQYALEDDFLFEALEGAAGFEAGNKNAIEDLNQKLKSKTQKKRSPLYIWMSAAAAVVILVVAITFIPDLKNDAISEVVMEKVEKDFSDEDLELSDIAQSQVAETEANEPETGISLPKPLSKAKSSPSQESKKINDLVSEKADQTSDQFSNKIALEEEIAESEIAPLEKIDLAKVELESTGDGQVIIELTEAPPAPAVKSDDVASPSLAQSAPVASRQKKELRRSAFQNAETAKISSSSILDDGISTSPITIQYNDPGIALKFQEYALEQLDLEGFPELIGIEMIINDQQEAKNIVVKTILTPAQNKEINQLVESFKEWGEAGNKTLRIMLNK
ncbi:hypothetical protein [Portibacter lacus]|nr:hypothetical protein [Portibacter lacus]